MRILHVGYGFRPYRHGGLIKYAEDLMAAQVRAGHEVAYFLRGRHYPLLGHDRLHAWSRDGVAMRELVNSTLTFGGDTGTRTPEADTSHPPSEARFAEVLDAFAPDVVHLQELIGLPTALIDVARARAVPVVMTLQDYWPLCPTLKLFDVDAQLCLRHDVGAQCARCSAAAPAGTRHLLEQTVAFELRRGLPPRWQPGVLALAGRARRALGGPPPRPERAGLSPGELAPPPAPSPATAARYQARRELNVQRLSRLDLAIAQSRRVGEIYATLGVDPERLRVVQFTLGHIEHIVPRTIARAPTPVRFATLNGLASVEKGTEVVLGALAELERAGLGDRFTLTAFGYITDEVRERLEAFPSARYGGYYEPERVGEVLEDFDVGIVPSIWEEAYGYVGVEFLAKGLPVIGSGRGGIVDYVRDGETGWVDRDASAAGLARIMGEIVRRPEQVVELNAALRARRADIVKPLAAHVREMEGIYGEVVEAARARAEALGRLPAQAAAGRA